MRAPASSIRAEGNSRQRLEGGASPAWQHSEERGRVGGKGALLGKLQEFVARNNMGSYVSFVGFIDETHKAKFLAKADLAVFPSTSGESFGIVLLEAMAAAGLYDRRPDDVTLDEIEKIQI